MAFVRMRTLSAALLALAALPVEAAAQLPGPVRQMLDTAVASGDREKLVAVAEVARATYPDETAEIEWYMEVFEAEQERIAAREAAAAAEGTQAPGFFEGWSGEGEVGAFRATGNADELGVTAGLTLERLDTRWEHTLQALFDYQRVDGIIEREQYLLAYETRLDISERTYAYGLARYERAPFQGYTSRYSVSGGVGFRVIDTADTTLRLQGGPAYRLTEFVTGLTERQLAALASLDFDWQLAEGITFTQDARAFYQSGNSTFQSSTGLEAEVLENVSVRFSYTVEHDNAPPAGSVRTDTLTRFTVIYGF